MNFSFCQLIPSEETLSGVLSAVHHSIPCQSICLCCCYSKSVFYILFASSYWSATSSPAFKFCPKKVLFWSFHVVWCYQSTYQSFVRLSLISYQVTPVLLLFLSSLSMNLGFKIQMFPKNATYLLKWIRKESGDLFGRWTKSPYGQHISPSLSLWHPCDLGMQDEWVSDTSWHHCVRHKDWPANKSHMLCSP